MTHQTDHSYKSYRSDKSKQEFETRLIDIARVTRVAAGGKHLSFRAVVIGGDKKGRVGIGIGKGLDVAQAIEKANRAFKKHLLQIPIVKDTIPYPVQAKFGPSEIIFKPHAQGRGIVVGGPARIICQLAGIKNISAKFVSGTHNNLNNAMAAMKALAKIKNKNPKPKDDATPPAQASS
ncbi:MAG: 30S ribosomal protein S5 [Candidatus Wildermuthbacteria bacterium]|nr:30S ribosomal protein S5 [Candidatus Wildermuthbacteria bacterium]